MTVSIEESKQIQFTKYIPKIEIHAHLNGSIRESTLVEFMKEQKTINQLSPSLLNLLQLSSSSSSSSSSNDEYNSRQRSLSQCFEIFPLIHQSVNTTNHLKRITEEALLDFSEEYVCYLELRTTPRLLPTKQIYIDTIVNTMSEFEKKEWKRYQMEITNSSNVDPYSKPRMPLIPRLLISIDRSGTVNDAMEHVKLAIQMLQNGNKYIVGVDLSGNPTKNEFKNLEPALTMAKMAGLKISIHCGEVPYNPNNCFEKEAYDIIDFHPDRLGHALYLPPSVYEKLYKDPIPIECCPTSNIMTMELNTTKKMKESNKYPFYYLLTKHPKLSEWMTLNYPISISTDDSGVFHTNSSLECLRFMKAMNVSPYDMGQIMIRTIDHIFERYDLMRNQNINIQNDIDIDGFNINVKQFLKKNMMKRISELVKWME